MTFKNNAITYVATAALLFSSTESMAAGFNLITNGAKMLGVGGAGVAVSFDPTSGTANPATIAKLKNEISVHPGLAYQTQTSDSTQTLLTFPNLFLRNTSPVHNHNKWIPGVYAGFVSNIDANLTFGMSLNGNVNSINYKASITSPFLTVPTEVKSYLALLNMNLAYKVCPTLNVGAALIVGYSTFTGNPVVFTTRQPSEGFGKTDFAMGIGGRVGVQWDPNETFGLGLAVTTPVAFGRFTRYDDYFLKHNQLPWTIAGGAVVHFTKETDLIMDVIGEFWGDSSSAGPLPVEGYGWKNTVEFKIGIQHRFYPWLPVRVGYRYAPTVMPSNEVLFNTFFSPASYTEHAVTFGFSVETNSPWVLDFGILHRFKKSFQDDGTGVAGIAARNMRLSGEETAGTIGLNYKL